MNMMLWMAWRNGAKTDDLFVDIIQKDERRNKYFAGSSLFADRLCLWRTQRSHESDGMPTAYIVQPRHQENGRPKSTRPLTGL